MRDLEIKLTSWQKLGETIVYIDDKPIKAKKNKFGSLIYKCQTENENVNIKVYRMLDVGGVFWFITQLFLFAISIFGIFDVHYKAKYLAIDFEFEVDLREENKITLQCNYPKNNGQAINVKTDLIGQEVSNKYYLDTKAKKMLIGLRVAKIFLTLAIIATVIVALMNIF